MLADGVQFFPAATCMMSQTLFPITWFMRAGCDAVFTGRSSLEDKSSGHGEISLYELTAKSKDYKGTLAPNCWNDLWFFKLSIFSPARHDAASAIAMSASIQKQSQRPKLTYLQDTSQGAGFTVGKCKKEKEMKYWQIYTAHAQSAQSRIPKPHL